ncbi:MAG: hypothetical protein HZA93_08150 [Verrucomicrobia bacterium]|nr:hypothetical protein [Verrucomicrobiota bacterium]
MNFKAPTLSQLTKRTGVDMSGVRLAKLWEEIGSRAPDGAKTANITGFTIVPNDVLYVTVYYTDTAKVLAGYDIVFDLQDERQKWRVAKYKGDYGPTDGWVLHKIPEVTTMVFKNAMPAKNPRKKKP